MKELTLEGNNRALTTSPSSRATASPPASAPQGVAARDQGESGSPDVGVIVCDAPEATSAARFTALGGPGAAGPAVHASARELGALRAVVVNSGNANAATGRPGF